MVKTALNGSSKKKVERGVVALLDPNCAYREVGPAQ
jgi:hypothetical protein